MNKVEYEKIVAGAGDDLLISLDLDKDAEFDIETQVRYWFHDLENDHPCVIDEDLAIDVIRISPNPCAEFSHHGAGCIEKLNMKDSFPFNTIAGAALAEDVKDYLNRQYGLSFFSNTKMIRAALKKLKAA